MPFDHFDFIAKVYERTPKFTVSDTLLRLMALPVDGTLLDVGGGTGHVSAAMRSLVDPAVVVDSSRGMLRQALAKELIVVCAPAEQLPFSDGAFARIIMRDAFHHLSDQGASVGEMWRVLSPGGRIVIIEPDIDLLSIRLLAVFERLLLMRSHFMSVERIAGLFRFRDVRIAITRETSSVYLVVEKVRSM